MIYMIGPNEVALQIEWISPFNKNTPGHSTLANVYLDTFPIDHVIKEINENIKYNDWNNDIMTLYKSCYSID